MSKYKHLDFCDGAPSFLYSLSGLAILGRDGAKAYINTESLTMRGIDAEMLARLIDDAIEAVPVVPVVPVYRFRWANFMEDRIHLIKIDEGVIASLSKISSNDETIWYNLAYQVVSTMPGPAKTHLLKALNIEPSEVHP
jgi:hypothetical protein